MNAYLFVNPASGHHSKQRLQFSLEQLRANAVVPEIFYVRTPAEIFACCDTINAEKEPHLVIVAGGDGTINAVVNGLEQGSSATLAVLPFGTSNVLAAELGLTSLDDALMRIFAGKTKPLSLGVIELAERTYRFILMAGIGLDGAVVRDVWTLGKKYLRQGAYALSALKNAMAWDSTTFTITTSEGNVTCHSVIICNASRYGGNFVLEPESSLFTQGLTAICVTKNQRRTYMRIAAELFSGTQQQSTSLMRLPVATIEINGTKAIQIDGDFIGHGPARISTLPDFLRIIA
jgi:YegS/Rv2252/BmrU family lipid kinase